MKLGETPIDGAYLIEQEPACDERGSFARTYCAETFQRAGLLACAAQASVAVNLHRGTLRGLHYSAEHHPEAKLVSCVRGRAFDVLVDVRRGARTFGRWFGVELAPSLGRALYVPPGVAHGYLTLQDDTALSYQMSAPYRAEAARGVRYDDPFFAIVWPERVTTISERDRSFALVHDQWDFACAS